MPLRFTCPACGQTQQNISRRFLGKRIQCRCGQIVRLGPKQGEDSAATPPSTLAPKIELPPPNPAAPTSPKDWEAKQKSRTKSILPDGEAGTRGLNPQVSSPPEAIERMFGKRPPRPRRGRHRSPPLNPVGQSDNPFRDGLPQPEEFKPDPAAQMTFPPLDVPVAVTPIVVPIPYDTSRSTGLVAALSLLGGILGTAQGILLSLMTLYLMLKLGALWSATSGDQLGLSPSMRTSLQSQLLIDLLLLGILLLINVGLAIAAGLLMISGIFETRREIGSEPQPAVNAGLVAGLYLVLLLSLAILYYFTEQPPIAGLLEDYTRTSLFGSLTVVMLAFASFSLIPTLLVNLGALRSGEH